MTTDTPFPNQPPSYADRNLYADDLALQEALAREGGAWSAADAMEWGATLGTAATLALGDIANRHPPELATHDARGERIDVVTFHPAWHEIMRLAVAAGVHCRPWVDPRPGAQVARGALVHLHAQVENGTQCPLTMTYASIPVLRHAASALPAIAADWMPKVLARDYDPRDVAVGAKRAALIGMGMTERQGGSDVRSNRTRAVPDADGAVRLTGHKWFFSAPQCDAHLVLAQEEAGFSCFLLPRRLPDGTRNASGSIDSRTSSATVRTPRPRSSSTMRLRGRSASRGRGVATILEMVQHTRLDCVLGTAGMMRSAVARAIHHARHRVAFGRLLVLPAADDRGAGGSRARERGGDGARAPSRPRLSRRPRAMPNGRSRGSLTPAAKYWVCKRGPALAAEAMEVLGGNGYVEDSGLPRLYREMPVNSIWEGSGNVMCLDVVRAARREPEGVGALGALLAAARGANPDFDSFASALADGSGQHRRRRDDRAADRAGHRHRHRGGRLLLRDAPAQVAAAFCATRLAPHPFGGGAFGALPASRGTAAAIVARALPD